MYSSGFNFISECIMNEILSYFAFFSHVVNLRNLIVTVEEKILISFSIYFLYYKYLSVS